MFKNLRNKVAVLALVALGLAFGHAWSSQAEKTNGALIYQAIMKGELPDEDGKWKITHEVAQEEKEQKEEQEQEGKEPKDADNSTSNWTIRSNGTSPTETTLPVGIRDKIKTAIELLLKNDDVVKYITIHNIASGHIGNKSNNSPCTIKHQGIVQTPQLVKDDMSYYTNMRNMYKSSIERLLNCVLDVFKDKQSAPETVQAAVKACYNDSLRTFAYKMLVESVEKRKLDKLKFLTMLALEEYGNNWQLDVPFCGIESVDLDYPDGVSPFVAKMIYAVNAYRNISEKDKAALCQGVIQKITEFADNFAENTASTVKSTDDEGLILSIPYNDSQRDIESLSLDIRKAKSNDTTTRVYIRHFAIGHRKEKV